MPTHKSLAEPSAELLAAARHWVEPVRTALGPEFISAYITGGALTEGFDLARAQVNLLVVARSLAPETLDRVAEAIPESKKPPHFDPMFMTREQMLGSLDVFPIEWLDLAERHLLLDGEDVFTGVEVPLPALRLQCEHELRGKHVRLRYEYLASARRPERLAEVLARLTSGFHTLFRTLLRLRDEVPPANHERVIVRVSEMYGLEAPALLAVLVAHRTTRKENPAVVRQRYRAFLVEIDRLVAAIDGLRVS
jgi:hypothetical protein